MANISPALFGLSNLYAANQSAGCLMCYDKYLLCIKSRLVNTYGFQFIVDKNSSAL